MKKTAERFNITSIKKGKDKEIFKKKEDYEESERSDKNDNELFSHNYKTRRNRVNAEEPPPAKIKLNEEKKPLRISNRDKTTLLTYEELGLVPISDFDY